MMWLPVMGLWQHDTGDMTLSCTPFCIESPKKKKKKRKKRKKNNDLTVLPSYDTFLISSKHWVIKFWGSLLKGEQNWYTTMNS